MTAENKYALAYREDDENVCEIFEDWAYMMIRFKELNSISKTVYKIVPGPDNGNSNNTGRR